MDVVNRLDAVERRYDELNELMARPEVFADVKQLQGLARERTEIEGLVSTYRDYKGTLKGIEDTTAMLEEPMDDEMGRMVREEIEQLTAKRDRLLEEIKLALLPRDSNDDKNVIVEIRAGAGGDEAGLFAADLYRMYTRYAERMRYKVEVIDSHESGIGGFKEITFSLEGKGAYSRLKYERGVHRVQRVPATEASGRIHTSTATVAVLPEVEDVEVDINQDDLRIDIYCAGGHGGQNVNKVATAVRITHLPTNMVVTCQDERSQLKNKTKAMSVLRARLYDIRQREQMSEVTESRRLQVGSGDRAEKIRTYNFPQDRVTDHRIGLTMHNLPGILDGDIDQLVQSLALADQADLLQEAGVSVS